MILTFAHTTPALLAGVKTVTRRDWKPQYAAKFQKGMIVDAWNFSPRNPTKNPRRVARIELIADPILECTDRAPIADYHNEGFGWMEERGLTIGGLNVRELWNGWFYHPQDLYVVRFKLVEVCPPMLGGS